MSDLISRKRIEYELCESNIPKKYREFCRRVINSESLSPSVDAKPVRHGHWVVEKTATGGEYTRCSKCGLDFSWKDTKFGLHKLDMRGCDYCPACGAEMDGEAK